LYSLPKIFNANHVIFSSQFLLTFERQVRDFFLPHQNISHYPKW